MVAPSWDWPWAGRVAVRPWPRACRQRNEPCSLDAGCAQHLEAAQLIIITAWRTQPQGNRLCVSGAEGCT